MTATQLAADLGRLHAKQGHPRLTKPKALELIKANLRAYKFASGHRRLFPGEGRDLYSAYFEAWYDEQLPDPDRKGR